MELIRLFPTTDIPFMLRRLADRIENGDEGDLDRVIAFTYTDDNEVNGYVWGEGVTSREVIALLTMATHATFQTARSSE